VGLFLVSAPAWWLFEIINLRTQNWYYEGRHLFSDTQYFVLASLAFSTVMPAVFGTAEWVSTFNGFRRVNRGPRIAPAPATLLALFATGCLMLALLLVFPLHFFPLMWISIFFIVEPINVWLGHRSLLQYTAKRDWRPIVALWAGCLIPGFLWELWNFFSYPRWVYQVPFFDFLRIFEMPLLGYGGHVPFSMELFALYHLAVGLRKPGKTQDLIQLLPNDD
jgi:hypothetical protein